MRLLAFIHVFMFCGGFSFACPDLTGTFVYDDGDYFYSSWTIEQTTSEEVTTYTITDDPDFPRFMVADGVTRERSSTDSQGNIFVTENTVNCVGDKLVDSYDDTQYSSEGVIIYRTVGTTEYFINDSNDLQYVDSYKDSDEFEGGSSLVYKRQQN